MNKEFIHRNEQQLLLEVSQGSEVAFKDLFDDYKAFVYTVSLKILKTTDYSEDVLQEVFLKIWLNRVKLADIENFKGYLTTIVTHHVYNLLRKRAYETLYVHREIRAQANTDYRLNDFQTVGNAVRFYSDLENGISSLTKQQQRIFRLSRIDGLKHAEIASLLKISKETVKKHIMASLQIIRKHMAYYNDTEKVLLLLFFLLK